MAQDTSLRRLAGQLLPVNGTRSHYGRPSRRSTICYAKALTRNRDDRSTGGSAVIQRMANGLLDAVSFIAAAGDAVPSAAWTDADIATRTRAGTAAAIVAAHTV